MGKAGDAGPESRKERYRRPDDEDFPLIEKLAYFMKFGVPALLVLAIIGAGGYYGAKAFRGSVRPDAALEADEEDALTYLEKANQYERSGNDILATEQLRLIIRKYPNTAARQRADELLERHGRGEVMFAREGATDRSRTTRTVATANGATGKANPQGRGRRGGGAVAGAPSAETDAGEVPAETVAVAPPTPQPVDPEQARLEAIKVALAKKAAIDYGPSGGAAKTLPAGFIAKPGSAVHISGWPAEIICQQDSSEMAFIPAGTVTLGSPEGPENERPQFAATLSPFYIDKFEITADQYARYRKETPEAAAPSKEAETAMSSPRSPIVGVTFGAAAAYCVWTGKQLPTEAQWERAARGPQQFPFPWGNDPNLKPADRVHREIGPILSYPVDRSAFAVFDLSGNAAEWCSDWYSADAYSSNTVQDPQGPLEPFDEQQARVIRGSAPDGNIHWRAAMPEMGSAPWLGFRGVLIIQEIEDAPPVTEGRGGRGGRDGGPGSSTTVVPAAPVPTGRVRGPSSTRGGGGAVPGAGSGGAPAVRKRPDRGDFAPKKT